jgi:hypothetical protein
MTFIQGDRDIPGAVSNIHEKKKKNSDNYVLPLIICRLFKSFHVVFL